MKAPYMRPGPLIPPRQLLQVLETSGQEAVGLGAFSAVGFEVGSGRKSCKRPIDDPLTITFRPESQDASKQCLLFIRTRFRSTPLHGWLDGHGTETFKHSQLVA